MGLRGPLPKKAIPTETGVAIAPPAWLNQNQRRVFASLLDDFASSGVKLAPVDAQALALTASAMEDHQRTGSTQARRDAIQMLGQLGATPMARARLGVRSDEPKKTKMAQLLKLPSKTA